MQGVFVIQELQTRPVFAKQKEELKNHYVIFAKEEGSKEMKW